MKSQPTARVIQGQRLWIFRIILAVVLPAILLFGLESLLRGSANWVDPACFTVIDKDGGNLVRDNPRFSWQFFPRTVARAAPALAFSETKPARTIRIFVLGASAAQGDPAPTFGFGRILEALLKDRYPLLVFEVINTAITATNSHVVLPIAREVAEFSGDLTIIYLGNNEVVGPYGVGSAFFGQSASLPVIRAQIALRRSGLGQLASGFGKESQGSESWRGMATFLDNVLAADDSALQGIAANYERNLRDVVNVLRRGGSRVLVGTVAVNLRHCAPFASLADPALTSDAAYAWEREWAAAQQAADHGDWPVAVQGYTRAAGIDSSRADLHFRWAQALVASGQFGAAERRFLAARELDALRFRADNAIDRAIHTVAAATEDPGVALVDVAAKIAAASPGGISGHEFFWDHVHFNFDGNYLVARTMLAAVEDQLGDLLGAVPTEQMLTRDQCAQQLAYTVFEEARVAGLMAQRLAQAPFDTQADHLEQITYLNARREQLRQQVTSSAFVGLKEQYAAAIAARPQDPWLYRNRSRLAADQRQWSLAISDLKMYLALLPQDAPAQEELAGHLAQNGHFAEAATVGEQLRVEWPDFAAPRYTLAYALSRVDRYEESLAIYDELLILDPGAAADIYNAVGRLEAGRGQHRAAVTAFEEAVASVGRQEETELADIVYNLSQVLGRMGLDGRATVQLARAAELYREALQENPESLGTLLMLGRLSMEQGQPAAAANYFRQVTSLDNCHRAALVGEIQALEAAGRRPAALMAARQGRQRLLDCGDEAGAQDLARYLAASP